MVSDKLDVTKLHPVSTEVKQAYVETNLTEGIDDNKVAKLLEESQANLKLVEETGHSPELCRNFNIWSLLGLGFGLTNSWLGISATLITGIASGGQLLSFMGLFLLQLFQWLLPSVCRN